MHCDIHYAFPSLSAIYQGDDWEVGGGGGGGGKGGSVCYFKIII